METLARKRAGAKLGFYIHAFLFSAVMLALFTLNFVTSKTPWSLAPFLGWGLGVGIHAWVVFGVGFKDRLVKAEMAKLQKNM